MYTNMVTGSWDLPLWSWLFDSSVVSSVKNNNDEISVKSKSCFWRNYQILLSSSKNLRAWSPLSFPSFNLADNYKFYIYNKRSVVHSHPWCLISLAKSIKVIRKVKKIEETWSIKTPLHMLWLTKSMPLIQIINIPLSPASKDLFKSE